MFLLEDKKFIVPLYLNTKYDAQPPGFFIQIIPVCSNDESDIFDVSITNLTAKEVVLTPRDYSLTEEKVTQNWQKNQHWRRCIQPDRPDSSPLILPPRRSKLIRFQSDGFPVDEEGKEYSNALFFRLNEYDEFPVGVIYSHLGVGKDDLKEVKLAASKLFEKREPGSCREIPLAEWPQAFQILEPVSVSIKEEGIYVKCKRDFVSSEAGFFLLSPRTHLIPEENTNPVYRKLQDGIYLYQIFK